MGYERYLMKGLTLEQDNDNDSLDYGSASEEERRAWDTYLKDTEGYNKNKTLLDKYSSRRFNGGYIVGEEKGDYVLNNL